MKRKIVGFLLFTSLLLTGCNTADNTKVQPEITPIVSPTVTKAIEANEEVHTDSIGDEVALLIPDKGNLLSIIDGKTVYIEDMDYDTKLDAIAFYKLDGTIYGIQLKDDNGWKGIGNTFSLDLNIIEDIYFIDLDNNNQLETLLLGTKYGSDSKYLIILEWMDNKIQQKVEKEYEFIDIGDYTKDGRPDIIVLEGERAVSQEAKLIGYEAGDVRTLSQVSLDPNSYHENIVIGKLGDGNRALFLDSGLGAHSMLTEIITYTKDGLIKIGDDTDPFLMKIYPLYCEDINKDGIIEAAGMYIPKGYENEAFPVIPFIYVYADYSADGSSVTLEERYRNGEHKFYITIPSELHGKVTIEKIDHGINIIDIEDNSIAFQVKWTLVDLFDNSKIKLGEGNDLIYYMEVEKYAIPVTNLHFEK